MKIKVTLCQWKWFLPNRFYIHSNPGYIMTYFDRWIGHTYYIGFMKFRLNIFVGTIKEMKSANKKL